MLFPKDLGELLNGESQKKKSEISTASEPEDTVLDESDECELTADVDGSESEPCQVEDASCVDSLLDMVNNASYRKYYDTHYSPQLENTRYAIVTAKDGTERTVLKGGIVWLLENNVTTRSSDRNTRVKQKVSTEERVYKEVTRVEKTVLQQGDWCVFHTEEKNNCRLGRVEVLIHTKGKTNQRFVDEWKWNEAEKNCDVGVLCTWFDFERTPRSNRSLGNVTGKLVPTPMKNNGYFPCKYYLCSVPLPKFDEKRSLNLSPSTVTQLNTFLNSSA